MYEVIFLLSIVFVCEFFVEKTPAKDLTLQDLIGLFMIFIYYIRSISISLDAINKRQENKEKK